MLPLSKTSNRNLAIDTGAISSRLLCINMTSRSGQLTHQHWCRG